MKGWREYKGERLEGTCPICTVTAKSTGAMKTLTDISRWVDWGLRIKPFNTKCVS